LHDGSVSVESEVGKGSRFTVSFPWQPDDRTGWNNGRASVVIKEKTVKQEQPISEAIRPPTLLVAEDHEALIGALTEYFTDHGYIIEVARNGIEAISQAGDIKPDLILMDIHLPVMDGLEAIRGIRASVETEAIPIIALTAMAMAEDEAICFEAGANAFLSKPVKLRDLVKVIETLLVGGNESEAIS
jgi:CheY-like chemotaxis protein